MTEPSAKPHAEPLPTQPPEPVAPEPVAPEPVAEVTAHAEPPPPAPDPVASAVEPQPGPAPRGTPVWLSAVLFIVLAGGIVAVYLDRPAAPVLPPMADPARLAAVEASLPALTARVTALENTVRGLSQRPAPQVDTSALDRRITALEQRPAAPDPDVTAAVAAASQLAGKVEALEGKIAQDAAQNAAKLAMAARLRAASAALDAGQPLGELPGAPPALSRFAKAKPPTEPELRLSFPAAAAAAETASQPSTDGFGFGERMWRKAQTLITVRRGDKVLIGAPAAVTVNAARARLDAGDLAGAVAALSALDGPAAAAMAPWRNDAQALLDARAALASLGARS
jgi:hypothetical protein